jgi:hypothetical protein
VTKVKRKKEKTPDFIVWTCVVVQVYGDFGQCFHWNPFGAARHCSPFLLLQSGKISTISGSQCPVAGYLVQEICTILFVHKINKGGHERHIRTTHLSLALHTTDYRNWKWLGWVGGHVCLLLFVSGYSQGTSTKERSPGSWTTAMHKWPQLTNPPPHIPIIELNAINNADIII